MKVFRANTQSIAIAQPVQLPYRNARGQAMAEGAAMMVVLTLLSVGLIVFIFNIGMTMVHQQKISFIAAQSANFFVTQSTGWEYQNLPTNPDINTFAKDLGQAMGFSRGSISATATQSGQVARVTVVGTGLPLLAGSFLPSLITVRDTFAAKTNVFPRPTALLGISGVDSNGTFRRCFLPAYSSLTGGVGSDVHIPGPGSFDQWSLGITGSSSASPIGLQINLAYRPGTRGTQP
jgi:hypothetical protein